MNTRINSTVRVALSCLALSLSSVAFADGPSTSPVGPSTDGGPAPAPQIMKPDVNHDGWVDSSDLYTYLSLWFAGKKEADTNYDGTTNFNDLMLFIGEWIRLYQPAPAAKPGTSK